MLKVWSKMENRIETIVVLKIITVVSQGQVTPRIVRSMESCRGIQSVFVFAGVTQSLLHTSV